MPNLKCTKPATALNGEPASKVERLGGAFETQNSIFKGPSQADSRRLIGTRYSTACPDTTMARAFLQALRRRVVSS
jgi:hypothetical protein